MIKHKRRKKEEYAGYLQNFFGGKKDGGRIGFESGANEMIKTQLLEEIMPETTTEDFIIIMTEDGPVKVKKSDYGRNAWNVYDDDTTTGFGTNILQE
jgi:cellulose synthase/poly-beta-1,6-N-acetylglucosamine synthase-like glycosyltransferase